VAGKSGNNPDDWIAFEAAGRLIDGPDGWTYDHVNRKRARAEALLKFAEEGTVRTEALKWTICKDGKNHLEASQDDRAAFLQMLLARTKAGKDKIEFNLNSVQKISNMFVVADDVNGHYEAARIEFNFDRMKGIAHNHNVTALRFSKRDIEGLFQLAEVSPAKVEGPASPKGGRPTAADWEAAALEMARRFYVGDLKPHKIADVQRQLTDWLASNDVHPGPTASREHAKRYFDAFLTWESE
jgi:hypothetical protein